MLSEDTKTKLFLSPEHIHAPDGLLLLLRKKTTGLASLRRLADLKWSEAETCKIVGKAIFTFQRGEKKNNTKNLVTLEHGRSSGKQISHDLMEREHRPSAALAKKKKKAHDSSRSLFKQV